jgi:hypothetical protein
LLVSIIMIVVHNIALIAQVDNFSYSLIQSTD